MHNGREVLGRFGLKVTPQRLAIWEALAGNAQHPSADHVFRRVRKGMPNISFDTVNRTLTHFAQLGVIHVVEGTSEVKRFDPKIGEHHHLRCLQCGKIFDFEHEAYNALAIPKRVSRTFKILRKKVVLEGLCEQCQKG